MSASHPASSTPAHPDLTRLSPDGTLPLNLGDAAPAPPKPFTELELLDMWGGHSEPVVSVLCPTFNHKDFIAKTLDGILGQVTDFPFEVIVRDGRSGPAARTDK